MKKTCSLCKKKLKTRNSHASIGNITHFLCTFCALEITKETPRTVGQILNLINEPIFLIDNNGAVQGANESASEMLNKKLPDIEGQMGGDAFECAYAKQEDGCGKSIHCKTCAIRNIVMETLASGHGFDKVPAFQSIITADGSAIMKFIITTEKVGDQVLLRIDNSRKGFSS
jgi:PAS domain-containing protein